MLLKLLIYNKPNRSKKPINTTNQIKKVAILVTIIIINITRSLSQLAYNTTSYIIIDLIIETKLLNSIIIYSNKYNT